MKKITALFLLFVTFSCNNNSKECKDISCEIERTKKETIDMHDVVMARMGEIRSLKSTLEKADSIATDEEHLKIVELINQINSADKEMWDWMHSFNASYKGETDSLTLIYFKGKLEGIRSVREAMDTAIKNGNSY